MYLAILWHFHQPIYKNPENGEYVLPWVNYHTVKNYYQMACLVEETEFPCSFNFVPCLLEQIEDYARGRANDPYQEALELDPDKLAASQLVLLRKFRTDRSDKRKIQLQALLSFFTPVIKVKEDKDYLLNLQKEIHKDLIPFYKKLWKKGLIEITTSPYYHPLLPLIFDIESAADEKLPSLSFKHPEDGEAQIEKGKEYFKKIFGDYPRGLWPSEGGMSQEVAHSISQKGFTFSVTDENILRKSLKKPFTPKELYEPYFSGNLAIFFRDRELSDLLSFEYQKWAEKDAVNDFLRRLEEKKRICEENSICVIALDGENPWAYYRQNGVPFLKEFFTQIKKREGITPIFLQDYLSKHRPSKEITLVAGTWLGNFSNWVGIPSKNEAWDSLSRARDRCGAREEIFIAEGSDWFWWYGEEDKSEFDFLFKSYIRKAHKLSGVKF